MRQVLDGWAAPDEEQEQLRRAFLTRLADGPQALRREGRPSHLTASALVLDARRTAVLLVHHRRTGLWLQPGGHVEDGDASLAAAALREAVEETGLADLRLLDEQPVHLERHPAPCGAEHHLDVRFAVQAPDGAVPAASEESLDVAWYALDALPVQRGVELQALISAALRASARTSSRTSVGDDAAAVEQQPASLAQPADVL